MVCFGHSRLFLPFCEGKLGQLSGPKMNREQLAVVSALVGAGGNLGAVIAGFCFYRPINDLLLPFQVHAGYVMFWALLTPCYYWHEHGGMFHGPAVKTPRRLQYLRKLLCKAVSKGLCAFQLPRLQNQFRSQSMIPYMQCRTFADYFTHGVRSLLWLQQ